MNNCCVVVASVSMCVRCVSSAFEFYEFTAFFSPYHSLTDDKLTKVRNNTNSSPKLWEAKSRYTHARTLLVTVVVWYSYFGDNPNPMPDETIRFDAIWSNLTQIEFDVIVCVYVCESRKYSMNCRFQPQLKQLKYFMHNICNHVYWLDCCRCCYCCWRWWLMMLVLVTVLNTVMLLL